MTAPRKPTRDQLCRARLAYLPQMSDGTLKAMAAGDADDDTIAAEIAAIHRVKVARELADKRAGMRH